MRLTDDQIKQAILHPEEEIRLTALRYFSQCLSRDETVMPVVIEAVQKYGRKRTFSLLRDAERLAQNDATVEWLIAELDQEFDEADVTQDNYRFALGLILCNADPAFLAPREDAILAAEGFPEELEESLAQVLEAASWDWETTWQEFERLGQTLWENTSASRNEYRRLQRLVRALARCPDARPSEVLNLLRRRYHGHNKILMQWLEPRIVELAGELQLQEAIPLLIERFTEDDDVVYDAAIFALATIGGEAVVRAIQREWPQVDEDVRDALAEVLEYLRVDRCVPVCMKLLKKEDDLYVAVALGHALLAQFATEGIEPVWRLVRGEEHDSDLEVSELRERLVAVAAITGQTFPEYEEWLRECLATNWGWGDIEPNRLADNFRVDSDDDEFDDEENELLSHEELDADEPCPCGSGKNYGDCCWDKDFVWTRDEQGKIYRSMPVGDELGDVLEALREAFVAEHGREPGAGDPLFPGMPHPEHLEAMMAEMMRKAGVPPAVIYAFEQTGMVVTEENQNLIPDVDIARWEAAMNEYELRRGNPDRDESQEFPVGAVAFYGPDATTTTKIVASVMLYEGAEPILKQWVGVGVPGKPKVQRQIEQFFQRYGVKSVVAAEANLGCPHEEGEDFPVGEDCPFCPYWKGKQGSAGRE